MWRRFLFPGHPAATPESGRSQGLSFSLSHKAIYYSLKNEDRIKNPGQTDRVHSDAAAPEKCKG
jgi:hypothetical protein